MLRSPILVICSIVVAMFVGGTQLAHGDFGSPTAGSNQAGGSQITFVCSETSTWTVNNDQYNLQPEQCDFYLKNSNGMIVALIEDNWQAGPNNITTFTEDDQDPESYPDVEAPYTIYGYFVAMDVNMNLDINSQSVTVNVQAQ